MSILTQGGIIAYLLLVCAAFVVGLAVLGFVRLRDGADVADSRTLVTIDGVLFWGAFSLVLGILGTLVGVAQAAQFISQAGSVSSALIWGGIRVSLSTTIIGLVILSVSALLWFVLRMRFRTLA